MLKIYISLGIKGTPGANGNKGLDGQKGQEGEKGKTGHLGEKGTKGVIGSVGDKGFRGANGNKGLDGPLGNKVEKQIRIKQILFTFKTMYKTKGIRWPSWRQRQQGLDWFKGPIRCSGRQR